eukprot:1180181-Prorocentrum_minimum.AAC.11
MIGPHEQRTGCSEAEQVAQPTRRPVGVRGGRLGMGVGHSGLGLGFGAVGQGWEAVGARVRVRGGGRDGYART